MTTLDQVLQATLPASILAALEWDAKTDKELLEMAAKAAGYELGFIDNCDDVHKSPDWNPLTDDCEALRLAVKRRVFTEHHQLFLLFLNGELSADKIPSAATRRAIVKTVVATRDVQ